MLLYGQAKIRQSYRGSYVCHRRGRTSHGLLSRKNQDLELTIDFGFFDMP
jgi:hypothetical protein